MSKYKKTTIVETVTPKMENGGAVEKALEQTVVAPVQTAVPNVEASVPTVENAIPPVATTVPEVMAVAPVVNVCEYLDFLMLY